MKWSEKKAWEWYNARPWLRGYNGYPSNCVNRIAMWQKHNHARVAEQLKYEFKLAKETGLNAVRTIIQFEVWLYEHDSFMENLEEYFSLADEFGIKVMLVLGNDCAVPKEFYVFDYAHFGEQKVDWGYHSGIKRGQHSGTHGSNMGYLLTDEPEYAPKFLQMVEEIAKKYAKDERLLIWNVWNEIGNSNRNMASVPLMEKSCEIIRSYEALQPITVECWKNFNMIESGWESISQAEMRALELSDIISFHCYMNYADMVRIIKMFKEKFNRPLINSEWLNRIWHCDVEEIFPLLYLEKIGSFHWGLMQGYSQTYEPYNVSLEELDNKDLDFTKWMHDLYRFNGKPYIKRETDIIKKYSEYADDDFKRSGK